MQANKLTNVVEYTKPFTPKSIGDSSPQGLVPPIKNQSKNKFNNIAKIDKENTSRINYFQLIDGISRFDIYFTILSNSNINLWQRFI